MSSDQSEAHPWSDFILAPTASLAVMEVQVYRQIEGQAKTIR